MSFYYKQITAERDLSGSNFSNGEIQYQYNMPPGHQINLNKSFITMRSSLKNATGVQLKVDDGIGPSYLLGNNLFKQMYHHINGKNVSEARSYVSQIAGLRHRISNSNSYKKTFLSSTNTAKPKILDRIANVSSDGILNERSFALETLDKYGYIILTGAPTPRHTYSLTAATDTITFGLADAAAAPPDCRNIYNVGDFIEYVQNDGTISLERITEITDALSIQVETVNANKAAGDIGTDIKLLKRSARNAKTSHTFETVFKPSLGVWNKDIWMPAHHMELKMYPHPFGTMQKNAIQSLKFDKTHLVDFNFEVIDMIMYVCCKIQKHPAGQFENSFEDIRCQMANITTTSSIDNHFIVDRNSHSFTMAFQDEQSENSTVYSNAMFKIRNNEELNLRRYYMQYNGKILPNPYPQIELTASSDYLTQRYYEAAMYSGTDYFKDVETQQEWQDIGIYFTHRFGLGRNQTEKLVVSTQFFDGAFENDHRPNLLLFDHFNRKFLMKVNDQGVVTSILVDMVN